MPHAAAHAVAKRRAAKSRGGSGTTSDDMAMRRRLVLAAIVLAWFASGALLFSSMGLGAVDTLYLMVQIITTIGYGDRVPKTQAQKLACTAIVFSAYVLVANIIMAVIAELEDKLEHEVVADLDAMTHAIRTRKAKEEGELMSSGDDRPPEEDILKERRDLAMTHSLSWQDHSVSRVEVECRNDLAEKQQAKRWKRTLRELCISASTFLLCLVVGVVFFKLVDACSAHGCEKSTGQITTWADAFYLSVVTMTTVGFGDVVPQTTVGKAFSIFWMLASVAVTVHLLCTISSVIDQSLREDVRAQMTQQLFHESDNNSDGTLDEMEFLQLQLVQNGLATKEQFEAIRSQFRLIAGHDLRVSIDEYAEYFLPGEHAWLHALTETDERWLHALRDQGRLRELGEMDAW